MAQGPTGLGHRQLRHPRRWLGEVHWGRHARCCRGRVPARHGRHGRVPQQPRTVGLNAEEGRGVHPSRCDAGRGHFPSAMVRWDGEPLLLRSLRRDATRIRLSKRTVAGSADILTVTHSMAAGDWLAVTVHPTGLVEMFTSRDGTAWTKRGEVTDTELRASAARIGMGAAPTDGVRSSAAAATLVYPLALDSFPTVSDATSRPARILRLRTISPRPWFGSRLSLS